MEFWLIGGICLVAVVGVNIWGWTTYKKARLVLEDQRLSRIVAVVLRRLNDPPDHYPTRPDSDDLFDVKPEDERTP